MKYFVLLLTCFAFTLLLGGDVFSQSKIMRTVNNETIEKILKSLELKYQKDVRKDKGSNAMFFDYQRSEQACRLYNYSTDLWLECVVEKKMSREDINRWNAEAKFSRLVMIEEKGKTTLSLESQLDCEGGVTEAMITRYINRFDEEAKKFAKYIK